MIFQETLKLPDLQVAPNLQWNSVCLSPTPAQPPHPTPPPIPPPSAGGPRRLQEVKLMKTSWSRGAGSGNPAPLCCEPLSPLLWWGSRAAPGHQLTHTPQLRDSAAPPRVSPWPGLLCWLVFKGKGQLLSPRFNCGNPAPWEIPLSPGKL